jgi:uncharacterized glyoxalase superfamily protein PhnB
MKIQKFVRSGTHLPVKNLRETLDYYRDQLGFRDEWTFGDKDGGIRRDDMRMLFGENPDHVNSINNPSNRLPLIWFVEDIETIYKEFQDRKIKIESPLKDHPYGMREFAFIDINGYYIRISEPV